MKKANNGLDYTPQVLKTVIHQYQVMHIAYMVLALIFAIICANIFIFVFTSFIKGKDWSRVKYGGDLEDDMSLTAFTVLSTSAAFFTVSIITAIDNIGPAFAPIWYMIHDLLH